jgi:ParB family chromosome partitioning protein
MKKQTVDGRLITVPLNKLHISPLNARPDDKSDVTELAALLHSQGQLQNLIVIPEDGDHGAVGGGRRYRAFKLLEQQGKVPADHPVFCLVTTAEHALAASVAENSAREPMHPADEFYAFKVLSEEGTPVEDIAAQFGVTPLVVRRRLALSDVAPELIEIYRKGEMTLDALQAFTLTTDRKLQLKVWKAAQYPYQRNGGHLREALMAGKLQVSGERVAKFVGVDAYEAAGGRVVRDLFGTENSSYVEDMTLMQTLAAAKLQAVADQLKAEGWSFVKVVPEMGYNVTSAYGRSKPKVRELTAAERAEIASLEEIANAANEAMNADSEDELTDGELDELEQKAERAVDQINKIKESLETYSDRQMKASGVVLGLNHQGALEIHRGMIDPKVAAAKEKAKETAEREKRIAAGEAVEDEKPAYSEVLLRKLTANRSAAMSAHLLEAPRVALDLLCSTLLAKVLHTGYYGSSGLAIVPTEQLTNLTSSADDMEESKAWATLTARRTQLLDELPEDPNAIFEYVASRSVVDVVELLAFCTAACINTTTSNDHARPLEHIEQAIGLNMADWWQPTRKSYLGQVAKPVIIEALEEVGIGEIAIKQADKLKKAELAQKAEELLTDTGWLPALLRPKAPPAAKVAKAKVTPKPKAEKAVKAPAPVRTTPAKGKRAVPLHPAKGTRIEPLNPAAAWPFPKN